MRSLPSDSQRWLLNSLADKLEKHHPVINVGQGSERVPFNILRRTLEYGDGHEQLCQSHPSAIRNWLLFLINEQLIHFISYLLCVVEKSPQQVSSGDNIRRQRACFALPGIVDKFPPMS
jgi:hypothetical protein